MDFRLDDIGKIIELATKSTGTLSGVLDFYEKLKKSKKEGEEITKSDLESALIQLMQEIKDAQLANITLKSELIELRGKILDSKRVEDQFSRYRMHRTSVGHIIYALKEDEAHDEPQHYICPKCREDGKRMILQGSEYVVTCIGCGAAYSLKQRPNIQAKTSSFWEN